MVSLPGIFLSVEGRTLFQSKVAIDTNTITATRAAMGIRVATSPSPTHNTSRTTPAVKVDRRVRAPLPTLIIV